jgi:hypothetical protein
LSKKSNGKIIFLIEGDLYFKSIDLIIGSTITLGMNFTDQLSKFEIVVCINYERKRFDYRLNCKIL